MSKRNSGWKRRSKWAKGPAKPVSSSHFKKKALIVTLAMIPLVAVLAMPTPKSLTTYGIQIKMPAGPVIGDVNDLASASETNVAVISEPKNTETESLPSHHSADQLFAADGSQTNTPSSDSTTMSRYESVTGESFETAYASGQSFSGSGGAQGGSGSGQQSASAGSTGGAGGGSGSGGSTGGSGSNDGGQTANNDGDTGGSGSNDGGQTANNDGDTGGSGSNDGGQTENNDGDTGGGDNDPTGPTIVEKTFEDVVIAGLFQPGNSPGIENFDSLTLLPGATTEIEIGGVTPGQNPDGYDQVNVSGHLILGGILDIILYNGFFPEAGDGFTIFTYGSVEGNFSQINGLSLVGDCSFGLTQTGGTNSAGSITLLTAGTECGDHSQQVGTSPDGNDNGDVTVNRGETLRPGQIPEPGMLAIFGLGLVGLAAIRRRRRA
jgi:hypothetical protein